MHAVIDFETRSKCPIKFGPYRYSEDPSTEVLCLAYKLEGHQTEIWHPDKPSPSLLFRYIHLGAEVHAHNVGFERAIWQNVCVARLGWPEINPKQWRCSAARCAHMTLPRSLEKACVALKLDIQKDTEGARVMQRLCKPHKPTKTRHSEWVEDPDLFERLYLYCMQDVEAEDALEHHLLELSPRELAVWQLDQEINARGLKIDIDTVEAYLTAIEQFRDTLREELVELTGGRVQTAKQNAKILDELQAEGVGALNLQAATVEGLLNTPDVSPRARRILEIRQLLGAASIGKLEAMRDRLCRDGRVRDNLMYYGASTGRWSGSGLQIQNFPRPAMSNEQIDLAREILPDAELMQMIVGTPIECAKNSLRSLIVADEGEEFFVCDYASIEARVTAWVANEQGMLQEFHEDVDVYKSMASDIYDCDPSEVTKDQRHIGKQAILGLGYSMGWKRFYEACTAGGTTIDRVFSKLVVEKYRNKYSNIRAFWHYLHNNCVQAFLEKTTVPTGCLSVTGYDDWMTIRLPSNRTLYYFRPEVKWVQPVWATWHRGDLQWRNTEDELLACGVEWKERDGDWFLGCVFKNTAFVKRAFNYIHNYQPPKDAEPVPEITYMKPRGGKMIRVPRVHGGLLTENVVQAISRDFLAEAMLRVDPEYPIVATVHDEIISEADPSLSLERFEELMCEVPEWGKGCPIKVEGYKASRYKK